MRHIVFEAGRSCPASHHQWIWNAAEDLRSEESVATGRLFAVISHEIVRGVSLGGYYGASTILLLATQKYETPARNALPCIGTWGISS